MNRYTIGVAAAAMLAVLAVPDHGGSAPEGFGGRNGLLVARRIQDTRLVVINASTARSRVFVDRNTFDGAWSPDGRRLAYWSYDDGYVWIADENGANPRRIVRGSDSRIQWSPDGSRLVYVAGAEHGNSGTLRVIELASRRVRPLRLPVGSVFSPDATRIAYVRWDERALVVASANGRHPRVVAETYGSFAWHPSGDRLVTFGPSGLVEIPLDGGSRRLELPPESNVQGTAISPDGTKLAYGSFTDISTTSAFVAYDLVSGARRTLWEGIDSGLDPDWQPLCTLYGTEGADVLVGTPGRDVICGLEGNDRIRALGGNDVVIGGPGNDVIDGGPGVDWLFASEGNDALRARDGARDVVDGGPGRDRAETDARDTVRGV